MNYNYTHVFTVVLLNNTILNHCILLCV